MDGLIRFVFESARFLRSMLGRAAKMPRFDNLAHWRKDTAVLCNRRPWILLTLTWFCQTASGQDWQACGTSVYPAMGTRDWYQGQRTAGLPGTMPVSFQTVQWQDPWVQPSVRPVQWTSPGSPFTPQATTSFPYGYGYQPANSGWGQGMTACPQHPGNGPFLGYGLYGQPKAFVAGQPLRNFVRYLLP